MSQITNGTPLWKSTVSQVLTGWGLHVYTLEGKAQLITDGIAIVHSGGCAYDPENWFTTREAALAAAADEIERLIAPAVRQVERLREGVSSWPA